MLTDRQIFLLKVIVDEFIQSAQPVGSRNISKKDEVTFSPATIRNDMADLEELGFLTKTHSSSGRIPSEKGYRYYVDNIMSPLQLSKKEIGAIKESFDERLVEVERVMQNSAQILSDMTKYTTLVLGPEVYENKLKQLQIVPLNAHSAIAILVTNTGHVEHRLFAIPSDISHSDLEKTVNILNDKLYGVPIVYLDRMIESEVTDLLQRYTSDFQQSYDLIQKALFTSQPNNLYVGGKSNILMQPEFNDMDTARSLFNIMESEERIAPILKPSKEGMNIFIGHENKIEAMNNCTLITTTYSLGENQVGTIALLGPTRMEYAKVVSLLDLWSRQMTQALTDWFNQDSDR
ncbi:heat-inducible transcriptional repressor HrcA [Halalkalibacillus sediminis]|uniref:Heat-inducible transcription repressor HrcA n=1 Tax=Halalkalibacillus sediminis TaxID=2018042 RepID=A0A2I0QXH9_9BACI|nr:heat-inducible transcriptional repressor HrcA [Halalkalibacillus sediminis]PKR79043.1 heat-inducible transcriptional repressor HrcA [Halalkalibacillus sediminis]